eukprot:5128212-Pyramimonas_sp.AAC.1
MAAAFAPGPLLDPRPLRFRASSSSESPYPSSASDLENSAEGAGGPQRDQSTKPSENAPLDWFGLVNSIGGDSLAQLAGFGPID